MLYCTSGKCQGPPLCCCKDCQVLTQNPLSPIRACLSFLFRVFVCVWHEESKERPKSTNPVRYLTITRFFIFVCSAVRPAILCLTPNVFVVVVKPLIGNTSPRPLKPNGVSPPRIFLSAPGVCQAKPIQKASRGVSFKRVMCSDFLSLFSPWTSERCVWVSLNASAGEGRNMKTSCGVLLLHRFRGASGKSFYFLVCVNSALFFFFKATRNRSAI